MNLTNDNERLVAMAHNAAFIDALRNSITAFSVPLTTSGGINWPSLYVINNKPTQIEGI
jgi:hypothetical protein